MKTIAPTNIDELPGQTNEEKIRELAALRLQIADLEETEQRAELPRPLGNRTGRAAAPKLKTRTGFDLMSVLLLGVGSYFLAARFDFMDRFTSWIRSFGADPGAMAVVLTILGFGLAWFAFRRWQERSADVLVERRNIELLQSEINRHDRLERDLLEHEEQELRRVRQNLYVGLDQQLTALACLGRVLKHRLSTPGVLDNTNDASRLAEGIDQTAREARELAETVYPAELETHGFIDALKRMASFVEKRYSIYCRVVCDGPPHLSDPGAAVQLYRIAQGAIGHAIRHGKAHHVLLEVSNVNNGVRLTVHDRVGFPDEIEQISGVSLRVMKLRARMIGARLEVERDSGGGYHLTCLLLPAAA